MNHPDLLYADDVAKAENEAVPIEDTKEFWKEF